jgi:hypothetical protein
VTLFRFAVRTGRYVAGRTGARLQAERRRVGIVLIAHDLPGERAASIRRWAERIPLPVVDPLSAERMGSLLNRERCEVVYVYDKALGRSIGNALGAEA